MKSKILKNKLYLLIFIFAIIILVLYYFELFAPIKDICIYFTKRFKIPGLFIVSVFLDLFVHPFTAGFFVATAVAGGMNLFLATLIAASGSMVGGNLYYFMGKSNKRIINVNKYDKLWNKFSKAIYKNNLLFLFLFSATTGPFSIISFFSGNIKIPLHKYLLIAFIGRSIKFFFYALISFGIFKLPLG